MSHEPVPVRMADDASSGLAAMVCQYLSQVQEDGTVRRRARRLRGRLGLTVSDQEAAVTVDFGGHEILVSDGATAPLDAAIAAPYAVLLELLRGEGHPLRHHLHRRLRVRVTPRHPLLPLAAYRLLRLRPRGDTARPWSTRLLVAGLVGAAIAGAVLLLRRAG